MRGGRCPQVQLVGSAHSDAEPECRRKCFSADQIRLLELQPGDIVNLDDRVA
jgi:hypothetical protein